jgi:serine/threonine protein kinase
LQKDRYSEFADVWSYGVVVWEIFSGGLNPYWEVSTNAEVLELVCIKGERLKPPKMCPAFFEKLLSDCFQQKPSSRPTFQKILDRFTAAEKEFIANGLLLKLDE